MNCMVMCFTVLASVGTAGAALGQTPSDTGCGTPEQCDRLLEGDTQPGTSVPVRNYNRRVVPRAEARPKPTTDTKE